MLKLNLAKYKQVFLSLDTLSIKLQQDISIINHHGSIPPGLFYLLAQLDVIESCLKTYHCE